MIHKGTLKSFDSGTYKASVQISGSLSVWLNNVATSRGIAAADMVAGRNVAVLFPGEPSNPSAAVVIAVWT